MRRFFLILMTLCLSLTVGAQAEETTMTRLDAVIQTDVALLTRDAEHYDLETAQCGDWTSVRVTLYGMVAPRLEGMQVYGMVYETETARRLSWEDLFTDGDQAADIIAELAWERAEYHSYSQYDQYEPVPRDNFSFENGVLTLWYPASQLSYFSGRCGALSLYPQELEAVYRQEVPVERDGTLEEIFENQTLPAPLNAFSLGESMAAADEKWTLVDVPDQTYDYACYRFEAPEMADGMLLAAPEETDAQQATIAGIMTEHFDLMGLMTGAATEEECIQALGEPDSRTQVAESDGYSRLPVGESLVWMGEGCCLELHFVEGVLHSVAFLKR